MSPVTKIADLLAAGRTYSFEFFPPKSDAELATLARTLRELEPLRPVVRVGDLPGRRGSRGSGPSTWCRACSAPRR